MRALVAALVGLLVATVPAVAQKPAGAHGYDAKAEVTLTGVVLDYHESKARNDHPGLHFVLQLATEASAPAPTAPAPEGETETTALPGPAEPGAPAGEATAEAAESAAPEPETVEVHACPVRLLSQLDFPIEKGDEVTVTGSRPAGGPIVIAREIKKGLVSLRLRDEKGVPIWTGLP